MVSIATVLAEKQAQTRRSFSMKYKRQAINAINDMMLHGHTVRTASNALNLPHWYYRRWRKSVSKVDRQASVDAVVPSALPEILARFIPAIWANLLRFRMSCWPPCLR